MPRIIMNRAFIARWTRMPHSTERLSASASSLHSLSSAAFITNIAESDFRHAQRPIYYGLGNLCFKTGHLGRRHENWIGMVAEVSFENGRCGSDNFRFVRHNAYHETIFRRPADETEVLADLTARSKALGATLTAEDDCVCIAPCATLFR